MIESKPAVKAKNWNRAQLLPKHAKRVTNDSSFLIAATTWYDILDFSWTVVLCHAFCMLHWPIGKDLDLSFFWGHHHLHLVSMNDHSTSWLLHYLLHRADETQQGRNSYPRLQFLAVQFGLCHVVVPLSLLCCNCISLPSLFSSLSSFGLSDLLPGAFSFAVLCIIVFRLSNTVILLGK